MKVLVLGASGMLGNAMVRKLSENQSLEVYGTLRSVANLRHFDHHIADRLIPGIDVENQDSLVNILAKVGPDVVVNCVGLIKQLADADDPLIALPINAMLPHRLSRLCSLGGARLIHMSTDCVFNGRRGGYVESDASDAEDLYGRSKYIGEVSVPHAITLRTSIIGHELGSKHGLVDWFLNQPGPVKGYANAIFSGLPTVELARVVSELILPRPDLSGVYHVAAAAISKYDLLKLVANVYQKPGSIERDETVVIDRSLNASRFRDATGYTAAAWPQLIEMMNAFDRRI
jgi:dTDP-4-dehydrorhamnose reductase